MSEIVRRLDFSDVKLYAVTPTTTDVAAQLLTIGRLLKGGVDVVQLRNYSLRDRALVEYAKKIRELCSVHGALFIVNNRPEIALAADADGVHLGHLDLPVAFAREVLGHRKIVGVSTHSLPEAIEAQRAGADYVSCGPIWSTPTKPEYNAVGVGLIGLYRAALRVPFVTIGGIDESNVDQTIAAGAKTIGVVRALFETANPEQAAKQFKEKLEGKVWR